MKSIKDVYDHYLGHLRIDNGFYKQVKNFQHYFIHKNDDHTHFFAEPLVGVYPVKWTSRETDMWFNDICETDEDELENDLVALPTINARFEISSNPLHLLFLYLIHRTEVSNLKEKEKRDCKNTLMAILNYKFISSIMSHNFRLSLADKAVAVETYNRLSKQFDLKVHQSWLKLLNTRAEEFISDRGVYVSIIKSFDDDKRIVDMVNDAKGRLNKTMVAIMNQFYQVKDEGGRIGSTSSVAIGNDGAWIKDLTRNQTNYIRYAERIIQDKNTFIKEELMKVVISSMTALDEDFFRQLMGYLCDNYLEKKKHGFISQGVRDLLTYTFDLMRQEDITDRDIMRVATRIRQNFMAGRVNDPHLVEVKKKFDKLVHLCNPKTKRMVITSERVAVMIYIVLRTLAMRHYAD